MPYIGRAPDLPDRVHPSPSLLASGLSDQRCHVENPPEALRIENSAPPPLRLERVLVSAGTGWA